MALEGRASSSYCWHYHWRFWQSFSCLIRAASGHYLVWLATQYQGSGGLASREAFYGALLSGAASYWPLEGGVGDGSPSRAPPALAVLPIWRNTFLIHSFTIFSVLFVALANAIYSCTFNFGKSLLLFSCFISAFYCGSCQLISLGSFVCLLFY